MMKLLIQKPLSKLTSHLSIMKQAMDHVKFLDMARQRMFIAGIVLSFAFLVIIIRLMDVMLIQHSKRQVLASSPLEETLSVPRSDIYDQHGNIVATHLVTASVYASPKIVINPKEAAEKLASLFPEIGYKTLLARLSSQKGFVWLSRHISPKMQQAVHELGIPGVYLQKDYKRVYPYGPLLSHILGYCGLDNSGLAGIEKYFDKTLLSSKEPLRLSIDVRIQHIVRDVLLNAIHDFKAEGANAMVMDLKTGKMLAMVSLPDFDPHQLNSAASHTFFNRNTLGVYEPGSTWKILNAAIALETGNAVPNSSFDARTPIKIGRFTITDFKAKNRFLSLTEAFVYSSNIASIKIAQKFGIEAQKSYFKKFGVMAPCKVELPEIGSPLIPKDWREATLMTASYGYGLSVTPLQIMSIVGSLLNDGIPLQPTLLENSSQSILFAANKRKMQQPEVRLISSKTSRTLREMMRMTALHGGSRKADREGYEVFAKTGTAYQSKGKSGYNVKERTTFCVGAFPFRNPEVMIIVMLDSPKATKETYNYATAGWNAAPTLGHIVERIAPVLGIFPSEEESKMKHVKWYEEERGIPQVTETSYISSSQEE